LSDTDTELKMLSRHSRISNLESFHQIQHNSTIVGTIAAKNCSARLDRSKCHAATIWVTRCLRNKC